MLLVLCGTKLFFAHEKLLNRADFGRNSGVELLLVGLHLNRRDELLE